MSTYNGKIITKGGQDNVVGYDQINNNPIFKMIIENLIKNGYNVNIVNGTKIFDIVYIRNDVAFGRRYTNMKDILNIVFAYSYIKDTNYYADFFFNKG